MSIPPGSPPGSGSWQYEPTRQDSPPPRRRWPRRHPVWSALIAIFGVLIIIGAATNPKTAKASHSTAEAGPTATATPSKPALTCRAQATSKKPRDHTSVTVQVHTAARAEVTATSPLTPKRVTGSASGNGGWAFRLRVGDATPGARIIVAVHVSRNGNTGSCQATFQPRAASAQAVAAQATYPAPPPSSAPAPPPTQAAPPSSAPEPSATPSCYPLSDEGTCYEPGEYCRDSDHGETGIAGDGEAIICEDNDGWRWEPE